MAENSKIEWTHHTFNPWTGCTKVSPACDHCYAEAWAKRSGHVEWGAHGTRRRTKTWNNPIKWNRQAGEQGVRLRVFCASLADVFDNHRSIDDTWRLDLFHLIEKTPNLDWLLLTKRPQNVHRFVPGDWLTIGFPPNVWIGTTVENQEEADKRIPHLLNIRARVRFLSMEPLLGPVNLTPWLHDSDCYLFRGIRDHADCCTCSDPREDRLDWVIVGGESGNGFREANPEWFRSIRDQCTLAGVPFLFKQWSGRTQGEIKAKGRALDGVVHDAYPNFFAISLASSLK